MQPSSDNSLKEFRSVTVGISLIVLALHYYYFCYQAFADWGLTSPFLDRIAHNIAHSGRLRHMAKLIPIPEMH